MSVPAVTVQVFCSANAGGWQVHALSAHVRSILVSSPHATATGGTLLFPME